MINDPLRKMAPPTAPMIGPSNIAGQPITGSPIAQPPGQGPGLIKGPTGGVGSATTPTLAKNHMKLASNLAGKPFPPRPNDGPPDL